MSRLLRLVRWMLEAGFVLAAIAGFCLGLAALSGSSHRTVDIFAQFTGPAAIAMLAGTGLAVVLRLCWGTSATVVASAVLVLAAWPQWAPAGGRPDPASPILRVYSANLYAFNTDVDAIARSIRAADADVVMLVELGDAPAARLDDVLAGYPHRVITLHRDPARGGVRTAIASRLPLAAAPSTDPAHHLPVVAQTSLGPVALVAVHLTRPWPFQFQYGQIIQANDLARTTARLPRPLILAGDFNSVSSARIGRQVRAQNGVDAAPGLPGTWPAALPSPVGMTIDQVYHSPELALVSRRLGRPTGSDHRPVVTEFARAR